MMIRLVDYTQVERYIPVRCTYVISFQLYPTKISVRCTLLDTMQKGQRPAILVENSKVYNLCSA